MSQIYRMKPHPKRVIWAGATLGSALGIPTDGDIPAVGEALDASGLTEMPSHVSGGADDGLSLCELFDREAEDLLGCLKKPEQGFPLLVKRLDAQDALSIQVHPDDAAALYLDDETNGKSEAWYILDAEKGASVHLGFVAGTTLEDVEKSLERGSILGIMREVSVEAGDVIPVPAGCAHTIGPGIYLFEVQQPSDLTYRLDDFGRLEEDGKPRELHIAKGLAAIDLSQRPEKANPIPLQEEEGGSRVLLVDMGVFSIEKWTVESVLKVPGGSLLVVQGLSGSCHLESEGQIETIQSGETVIIPASLPSLKLVADKEATLIIARHPRT